jgi:hypothetical protein
MADPSNREAPSFRAGSVTGSIRRYRRSGDHDLANAAQELLTALKAGYPCPSYRGLGDDGNG